MSIVEERRKTYKDLRFRLNQFTRCALIRPTGFGKTGVLTKLIKNYRKVVFFYPSDVVLDAVMDFHYKGIENDRSITNTTFITYTKLAIMTEEEMSNLGSIDLIVADECHRLGGEKTFKNVKTLLSKYKGVHFVGATATPDRMDGVDVVHDLLWDIVVYPYTLHDAFKDGLYKPLKYCYCSYNSAQDIQEAEKEVRLILDDCGDGKEKIESILKSSLIEAANISKMDNVIRNAVLESGISTNYLKFIVFFSSFKHMRERGEEVKQWYSNAFPGMEVNSLTVSSETKEFHDTSRLKSLKPDKGRIDLIFTVDMMNMGYHVDNLSGIFMFRGTKSNIVYAQQLGRCLSANNQCVVIDAVDNLHRESMYSVLGHYKEDTQAKQRRITCLEIREVHNTLTEEEKEELKRLRLELGRPEDGGSKVKWWKHCNELEPADLEALGHQARYAEVVGKALLESEYMRARQVMERWLERGGDIGDGKRSTILGRRPPKYVPFECFCELKSLSIKRCLDLLGITD